MSRRDALAMGLEDGRGVRLVSAANPTGTVVLGDGRIGGSSSFFDTRVNLVAV